MFEEDLGEKKESPPPKKTKQNKRLKELFLKLTEQDKMCKFSRKASFSSYVQQYNRKQLNQLILCPYDARRLAGGENEVEGTRNAEILNGRSHGRR